MDTYKTFIKQVFIASAITIAVFILLAWAAFQWRNPMSNEMSFYRHFGEVVTFQNLPEYQTTRQQ